MCARITSSSKVRVWWKHLYDFFHLIFGLKIQWDLHEWNELHCNQFQLHYFSHCFCFCFRLTNDATDWCLLWNCVNVNASICFFFRFIILNKVVKQKAATDTIVPFDFKKKRAKKQKQIRTYFIQIEIWAV